jgi:hypothetical protein
MQKEQKGYAISLWYVWHAVGLISIFAEVLFSVGSCYLKEQSPLLGKTQEVVLFRERSQKQIFWRLLAQDKRSCEKYLALNCGLDQIKLC